MLVILGWNWLCWATAFLPPFSHLNPLQTWKYSDLPFSVQRGNWLAPRTLEKVEGQEWGQEEHTHFLEDKTHHC
jgi:hypothetical protein